MWNSGTVGGWAGKRIKSECEKKKTNKQRKDKSGKPLEGEVTRV